MFRSGLSEVVLLRLGAEGCKGGSHVKVVYKGSRQKKGHVNGTVARRHVAHSIKKRSET